MAFGASHHLVDFGDIDDITDAVIALVTLERHQDGLGEAGECDLSGQILKIPDAEANCRIRQCHPPTVDHGDVAPGAERKRRIRRPRDVADDGSVGLRRLSLATAPSIWVEPRRRLIVRGTL